MCKLSILSVFTLWFVITDVAFARVVDLEDTIENVLSCARKKDIKCVSKYMKNPQSLYVYENGKKILYPYLSEEIFNDNSLSLYTAAKNRYIYRIFFSGKYNAEVVFEGENFQHQKYEDIIKSGDYLQCSFLNIDGYWKISNSLCGYLPDS